jgi:eukaryotic-like serine/threonine-protein kinase
MTRGANVFLDSVTSCAPCRNIHASAARSRPAETGIELAVAGVRERFRLFERLGQGGMGVVHRAFDREMGCEVALKAIDMTRPDDLYRLKREFRVLADLRHQNLVRLHELFVSGSTAFFTMELLFGYDLCRFIQGPPRVAPGPRCQVAPTSCDYALLRNAARQLAAALATVHATGKLHRDVKPSNILVTSAGRVVLFDFGLAASLCPKSSKTKNAGVLLGTRGYISPEQARGEALTPAADWYSFGVTLFEAATGRLPFENGFKAFLPDRGAEDHSRISRYLPDAPTDLDDLIAGLLCPAPHRRPTEADLLGVLDDPRRSRNRPRSSLPLSGPSQAPPDVGAAEVAQALETVWRGSSAILHLRGGDRAARTNTARQCVAEAEKRGALVLRGRCRVDEKLPFNALDEVVDDLSHALEHMDYQDLIAVLPAHVASLPRLFPVLGRLEAASDLIFVRSSESDSAALRRARGAFKDLVVGLSQRRPIVIWIDDVEHGDRESGELLADLLEPPDEQPILAVLSYRGDGERPSGTVEALVERVARVSSFEIAIPGRTSAVESRTLMHSSSP